MVKKQFQHLLIFIAIIVYLVFSHSCANPGAGPSGGPKDSIPPVILNMIPAPYATNVTSNEISITFDEYIVQDNLATKMVVSPPLAEKPTIRLKGKSIHIKFGEDLIPDRTYSVDLKDGIKDYNEGNKIESIRMLFSTYDNIDTLQIKGYLLDAFTLNPIKDAYATLYKSPSDVLLNNFPKIKDIYSQPDSLGIDSLFSTQLPDFIAKTDENGFFLFDNLSPGNYKMYGLTDIDNNLMYTQPTEQIAFIDSFIVPSAKFVLTNDTIIQDQDTIVENGHTEYYPEAIFSYLFTENKYNQYITNYERSKDDQMVVSFNESLTDSFQFDLISVADSINWSYVEYNEKHDSISIWITDTTLIHNDSLQLRVRYTALDTLGQMITFTDTLRMFYSPPEPKKKSRKKENTIVERDSTFEFTTTLKSNNFDLNLPILIEAPSPIEELDTSVVHLQIAVNDTVYEKVKFEIKKEEGSLRKYEINYPWAEKSKYVFTIDSAGISTLSGLTNLGIESTFKTQKLDYYGSAIFNISGVKEPAFISLLKNSDKENVVKTLTLKPGQEKATFDYLKPAKYKVKLFIDSNNNGEWDTGELISKQQPEPVYYFPKVINIKSNWELKEDWDINAMDHVLKNIEDPDKKKEKK